MRLGELSAWGESTHIFSKMAAAEKYSRVVKFDRETWQAMARVYARDATLKIAEEGIKLVLGYGDGEPALLRTHVNMDPIMAGQKRRMQDMDLIAEKLKGVFKMT